MDFGREALTAVGLLLVVGVLGRWKEAALDFTSCLDAIAAFLGGGYRKECSPTGEQTTSAIS